MTSQRYDPGVIHPDGATRIRAFTIDPRPRWTFTLDDGAEVQQAIVVRQGAPLVASN